MSERDITANLEHPDTIRTAIHAYLNNNPPVAHLYRVLLKQNNEGDNERTTLMLFTIAVMLGYPADSILESVLEDLDVYYKENIKTRSDIPKTRLRLRNIKTSSKQHRVLIQGNVDTVNEHDPDHPSGYQPGQLFMGTINSTEGPCYIVLTSLRSFEIEPVDNQNVTS